VETAETRRLSNLRVHELLVVIPHFPIAQDTGESITKYPVLVKKLNLFRKHFRECVCITGTIGKSRITREDGLTEIALDFSNPYAYVFRFILTYLTLMLRIRKKCVTISFNVGTYVLPSALITRILRSQFVMYMVSPLQFGSGLIRSIRLKLLLSLSNFVIVLTPQMAMKTYRVFPRKPTLLLPNWSDNSYRDLGLRRTPNTLLYVGRLSSEKRIDLLLGAMKIVASELVDARLYIVGDGSDAAKLKQLSERMRIEEKCEFLGWLGSEKVNKYYNTCELFVFPSPVEYFPNVLIEAMASGIPVVTVKNDSYKWIIDGAGVFCQPDSNSLAEGILEALCSQNRMAEMKKACIQADLRMRHILNRQLRQLDALLNRQES